MKIYTKTGDKGSTSLIGGNRVPKYHLRIEAYGTVDELMAFVALLHDQEIDPLHKDILEHILDRLMSCASILAADCSDCKVKIPQVVQEDIQFLEQRIDTMESELEPLSGFILPGGHPAISLCHVARTVCRRAERTAVKLANDTPVPETVTKYLNRLSDFFFVLSRYLAKELKIDQIKWHPKV